MCKIRLNVIGLTGKDDENGPYVLMLGEQNGLRGIPIVIGPLEAQSIATYIECYKTSKPFVHDLFFDLSKTYGIEVLEVCIKSVSDGIFFSEIVCFNGEKKVKFDSRTSDAIALALRFRCPIFTSEEVLEESGMYLNGQVNSTDDLFLLCKEELKKMLETAVEEEDYEKALTIHDELKRRKK